MGKELLAIPEEILWEVIGVIRAGLVHPLTTRNTCSERTEKFLKGWINEYQEHALKLKHNMENPQ